MILSAAGLALLKNFEGCRLQAYQDQRGVWTIGYGHTGPDVYQGLVWSQAQADQQLLLDTQARAQTPVQRLVDVAMSQSQFDALCDLCYNIGQGNLASSTLLRLLNVGNAAGAADQFLVWDKVNGAENAGLARRRAAERALFLSA
jgi:lysozyme